MPKEHNISKVVAFWDSLLLYEELYVFVMQLHIPFFGEKEDRRIRTEFRVVPRRGNFLIFLICLVAVWNNFLGADVRQIFWKSDLDFQGYRDLL